jgi:uncharacterized cofD-like protein
MSPHKKVVVIGGGTGSFTLLTGLKKHEVALTALVSMSDDGGSTGVLRDEYGVLPPGDVRQCLVALSDSARLRDLFSYRFADGTFAGHSFGNVFLSTAEKMTGSFEEAVRMAAEVLNISGTVLPITTTDTKLAMRKSSGELIVGEYKIGHLRMEEKPQLELMPQARITDAAHQAILEADSVIIAPGNLYGTLAPALLVGGVKEALAASKATVAYICNLVTKPKQTDGFMVHDYADEIERFIGAKRLDVVVYNTDEPPPSLLKKYTHDGEFIVEFDLETMEKRHYKAIGLPLIDAAPVAAKPGDAIAHARTLIRHDTDVLAKVILGL